MSDKIHDFAAIAAEIQRRINGGHLRPGQSLPSERHLAQEFRVSRAQIQSAIDKLQSLGLIEQSPNCRPRVRNQSNQKWRKPAPSRNQIALWIHPNAEDLGAATILKGIRRALGSSGYTTIIGCPGAPEHESEEEFLRSVSKCATVAGAIIWPSAGDTLKAYEDLGSSNIPFVLVDRQPPKPFQSDLVATNNRAAAKSAVDHLIELGHKRIAIVSNTEDVSSVQERIGGYRDALNGAGLAPIHAEPLRMPIGIGDDAVQQARLIVQRLIEERSTPTAIFAINDQIAMHLYDAITSKGLRIPTDFSLIGFDWFMRWVPSGGHITTVCQHFEEIGRIAVDLLFERIDSPTTRIARQVFIEAPLVLKGSTAPPSIA
jgi:DNA-binding LacI/PurR family transcriptional regulator